MTTLQMFRGDNRTIVFAVKDTEGQPLDLADYDIEFVAHYRSWESPLITKTLDDGAYLGGTTGEVNVDLARADTVNLNPVALHWHLRLINTDSEVFTVASGRLELLA